MGVIARVINKAKVEKELGEILSVKVKKAFDSTRSDVARRAPGWISKVALTTYAGRPGMLNPTTKAGSGKGSVRAVGDTLLDLQFVYKGERLTIGGTFKMKPAAHTGRPYQITTQILRDAWSPAGHWSYPRSEGGRYGHKSPYMLLPGRKPPLQRVGKEFPNVAKGLAVPQMVVSERHNEQMREKLSEETMKRLIHNLERVLKQ